MSPIAVVAMIMGVLLILAAIGIAWSKKEFSAGCVTITLVGVILIGLTQWTTIKFKSGGLDVELSTLKQQLKQTAAAVDAVAAETETAAQATEAGRQELRSLVNQLGSHNVLPPVALQPVRASLDTLHKVDFSKIRMAREDLRRITVRPR
jgi:hypothetical protein